MITYETAYRDEEEITYVTEYESRTRDVPVDKYVAGKHSNDSGDGVESEPAPRGGYGHGHHHHAQVEGGYATADSSDDHHHYTVTEYVTETY